jgi:hypothetical protein
MVSRCPKCRSFQDPKEGTKCIGCGYDFQKAKGALVIRSIERLLLKEYLMPIFGERYGTPECMDARRKLTQTALDCIGEGDAGCPVAVPMTFKGEDVVVIIDFSEESVTFGMNSECDRSDWFNPWFKEPPDGKG